MKDKGILDKSMHFLVHNSNLVTVAVMGAVHATLLVIMLAAGVMPLVRLNILSVTVYLFCVLLCRFGHIMPVFISLLLEVAIYAAISIHLIGWDGGSCCFLCSIIPIIIYFGCFLFKGSKRWIVILMLVLDFAEYAALFLIYRNATPIYAVSDTIKTILIIFSSFVMITSIIIYNFIYIYSSEYEMGNLEQRNKQLSADAHEDALTSLLNRRGFLPLVENLMNEKKKENFCVAFCDIDNFKRVNDSYGHDGGDEVLRHITRIIKREMQGCDICRWGGEEIIILMKDCDMDAARDRMEALRKSVETNPTVFFNRPIFVTITIGLEQNRDSYRDPDDIIKKADGRMYYGKQHGKNIVVYEEEKEELYDAAE